MSKKMSKLLNGLSHDEALQIEKDAKRMVLEN